MKDYMPLRDKRELRRHIGSMAQLAGVKRYRFEDGAAYGLEAVDVRTGGGLEYTVLPGRGMDIAWTQYRGVPVSYISKTGATNAASYDAAGMEWLRGFYAGMLTTCGFSNVGAPCEESHPVIGKRQFGLHGRLSYTPAFEVGTHEGWNGDEYEMRVTGKLRDTIVHGENLTLRRTIRSTFAGRTIELHDVIENEGNTPEPFMLLYHMNIGYPILGPQTRLYIASESFVAGSALAEAEKNFYDCFHAPKDGAEERCYFHKMLAGADGNTYVAVVNDALELGVLFTMSAETLPCVTEWKMLKYGEYVLGIEPGNTHPIGRSSARKQGTLPFLAPDEQRDMHVSIAMLDGREEIDRIRLEIENLKRG